MRPPVDRSRIEQLALRLAPQAGSATIIYLTGEATTVIEGWRASTVNVDVRFEPDSDELLRELPKIKEQLQINVALASPPDFIPELPGWRQRSPLILTEGNVHVRHFDLYSQALSKIERGFQQDLEDVSNMLASGLVTPERLWELYEQIEPQMFRYPAIEPTAFRHKLGEALSPAPPPA
jgi:hypothetical protein